jgi:hypothetical protein
MKGLSGITPAREPVGSQQYFEEEVNMAEIQGHVMDAGVKGNLTRLLDRIIDRSGAIGQNGKYSLLEKSITNDDLLEFEEMFDLQSAGRIISLTVLTEFKLLLEFRYIDRSYKGSADGGLLQKVARYRKIMGK